MRKLRRRFGNLLIHCTDSLLDAERALECIDRTREFGKNAVTGSIRNTAAVARG